MQYKISQEQELLKQTIGELAQSEIFPLSAKIDWEARVPDSLLQILPSYGLYGVTIPQEFGGAGADFLGLVVSIEELCKASASLGAQIAFHNAVVAEAMIASTNKDLRGVFLPKLASGILGAFFIDARSPVSCKSESDYFILNGTCEYVMSAVSAGIFLILTKMADGSRALVCFSKQDGDGLRIGPAKKLLGMRASQTALDPFSRPENSERLDLVRAVSHRFFIATDYSKSTTNRRCPSARDRSSFTRCCYQVFE
ncbi:MAG: acyl-CoA dehydrogenase family protein [Nitrososphaerota archaeon]|nr:acyl-CoA dehydrogenase family protein [Nitrososphaerota archaeon]